MFSLDVSGEEIVSCNHTVDYESLLLSVLFVNCTSLEVNGSLFWEAAVMVYGIFFSWPELDLTGFLVLTFFESGNNYASDNLKLFYKSSSY